MQTTTDILVDGKLVGSVPATGDFEADAARARQFVKDKGLVRPVTTLQAMYHQALSFGQTARMFNDQIQAAALRGMQGPHAPFAINHTFALEILLKPLAAAHGAKRVRRQHNLSKLFAQLPPEAFKVVDAAIVKVQSQFPPFGMPQSRALLESTLASLAEAFVKWRYYYETCRACRVNIPSALWAAAVLDVACIDSGANK